MYRLVAVFDNLYIMCNTLQFIQLSSQSNKFLWSKKRCQWTFCCVSATASTTVRRRHRCNLRLYRIRIHVRSSLYHVVVLKVYRIPTPTPQIALALYCGHIPGEVIISTFISYTFQFHLPRQPSSEGGGKSPEPVSTAHKLQ